MLDLNLSQRFWIFLHEDLSRQSFDDLCFDFCSHLRKCFVKDFWFCQWRKQLGFLWFQPNQTLAWQYHKPFFAQMRTKSLCHVLHHNQIIEISSYSVPGNICINISSESCFRSWSKAFHSLNQSLALSALSSSSRRLTLKEASYALVVWFHTLSVRAPSRKKPQM